MPVFNIWIEPTTNEQDLNDFMTTSLNDFCDNINLKNIQRMNYVLMLLVVNIHI